MKGLAIIGVVIGHCGFSAWSESFVNQWHLATFFFVAGMCFKDKYVVHPKSYIKRRIKSLYIPFVEFGLMFLIMHNVLYMNHCVGNEYSMRDMGRELFNLTIRMTSNEPLMGAMWFCPALMFTSVIMMLTNALVRKSLSISAIIKLGVMPLAVFLIGYTALQLHIKSPYCLWQYMVLSLIVWMGYWFRRYMKAGEWNTNTHIAITIAGYAIIAIATSYGYTARLQPANISKANIITITLIPMFAGLSVYSLSAILDKTKLRYALAYIGDHSFSIMALHFFAFKAVNLAQIIFYGYGMEHLAEFPVIGYGSLLGWGMAYVIVGVVMPLMLAYAYSAVKGYGKNVGCD